jgi:hypothetical protein
MKNLNRMLLLAMVVLMAMPLAAQQKSPKAEAKGKVGDANVTIVYSQPSARGRKVMGELVPWGKVWRTGANAATTIEFDKAVKIEGKDLAAGKYALFSIPGEKEWTIIFNSVADQFGHFDYNETKDVLRVTVKPEKTAQFVESFTITTEKDKVRLAWENTAVAFKVK